MKKTALVIAVSLATLGLFCFEVQQLAHAVCYVGCYALWTPESDDAAANGVFSYNFKIYTGTDNNGCEASGGGTIDWSICEDAGSVNVDLDSINPSSVDITGDGEYVLGTVSGDLTNAYEDGTVKMYFITSPYQMTPDTFEQREVHIESALD